ncbi:hypothetical protein [Methylopila sp. M107]|uniref:hypothetical protein n=1 Tax=Methylopila sp. M107 TaxID=1101190 RepID=UPI0003A67764|nr:hypothetical protein [Methylopila sp. M107]
MRSMIIAAAAVALVSSAAISAQAQSGPQPAPRGQSQGEQPKGQPGAPTVRTVSVVDISELPAETRPQVDAAAAKATPENLKGLRSSIDKSPEITKALAAKGAKSSDVIVANLDQQGQLTLVTKKRA